MTIDRRPSARGDARRAWAPRVRRILLLVMLCHLGALLWLVTDWHRARLLIFRVEEVRTVREVDAPPKDLERFGYSQDRPEELEAFRSFAAAALTSQDDLERFRLLADSIYLKRSITPTTVISGLPLTSLFDQMLKGRHGECGSMSFLLAGLARSLGYDTRQVIWFQQFGGGASSGVELYSQQYQTWVYYDVLLNGYATDASGRPLSLASIRSLRSQRIPVWLQSNQRLRIHDEYEFMSMFAALPWHWYRLNNRLLYYENDRRFGAMNAWSGLLSRLPYPSDRLADNAFGTREARLALAGSVSTGTMLGLRGLKAATIYLLIVTTTSIVLIVATLQRLAGRRDDLKEADSGLPSSLRRST